MLPFFDYCRQAYEQVFRIAAPADDPWEIGHGGSRRSFFRLGQPPRSLVGMLSDTPPADSRGITENDSFLYVALCLSQAGAPVPRVFAADRARGWFVMEDVGETLLYHEVQRLGRGLAIKALYRLAVDDLVWMHVKASPGFDSSRTHNPDYRRDFVRRHESGYFQQAFLQDILQWDPVPLSLDLDRLADAVDALWTPHFLYRDFQSQNIAVQGSRLRYLDFQGGRRGPRQYDLASLVYDPYAVLDSELQAYLVDRYVERARALEPGFDGKRFRADFPIVGVGCLRLSHPHRRQELLLPVYPRRRAPAGPAAGPVSGAGDLPGSGRDHPTPGTRGGLETVGPGACGRGMTQSAKVAN